MRRLLALAALLVPATAVLAYGCGGGESDEPPIEDLCGWLADPSNCYRKFAQDIDTRCGALGVETAAEGTFKIREELGVCILQTQNGAEYEGGQVVFDPPLDLVALTTPNPEAPLSQSFKFIKNDGTTCGTARFTNKYDFSISITGDVLPDSGPINETLVEGGSYQQSGLEGREVLDVKCPLLEEEHFFDRVQITKCRGYEPLLPHAELDLNPGSVGINGVVRLRIYYPPPEGELEGAQPYSVEYFQCIIPAPPGPCEDEEQNGNETDIDCGGPDCPNKCDDGQKCASDQDCRDGLTCKIIEGFKKCKE